MSRNRAYISRRLRGSGVLHYSWEEPPPPEITHPCRPYRPGYGNRSQVCIASRSLLHRLNRLRRPGCKKRRGWRNLYDRSSIFQIDFYSNNYSNKMFRLIQIELSCSFVSWNRYNVVYKSYQAWSIRIIEIIEIIRIHRIGLIELINFLGLLEVIKLI